MLSAQLEVQKLPGSRNDVSWLVPPADNPIQMTKICPTCTSVCDLCRNGFFWRQDSSLGLLDVNIIGGRLRLD